VWSPEPARRFAIVDGQRVGEGALLAGGIVAEIRPDGVVLEMDGRRVLLARP
jgi:general secretion pathway protein B